MKWILQAISDELDNQNFEIKENNILVGRHQGCDLILQSSKISRRHAAFHLKDQQLWLEDLQSSNGTFINEIQIDRVTQLESGDIIQFADLHFKVSLVADDTTSENVNSDAVDLSENKSDTESKADHSDQHVRHESAESMSQSHVKPDVKEDSSKQNKVSPMMTFIGCVIAIVIAFIIWTVMK